MIVHPLLLLLISSYTHGRKLPGNLSKFTRTASARSRQLQLATIVGCERSGKLDNDYWNSPLKQASVNFDMPFGDSFGAKLLPSLLACSLRESGGHTLG